MKKLIVVALILLTACSCEVAKWKGDGPVRVSVLGDSLVYMAETHNQDPPLSLLSDEIVADGYSANVLGVSGYATMHVHDELRWAYGTGEVDILILAVGTNDLNYQVNLVNSYYDMLAMIDGVPCVRFIDPRTDRPGYPTWNYMMDRVVEQHPDAARVVQSLDIPTIFDNVHHTVPEGTAMYRQLIRDAVEDCNG